MSLTDLLISSAFIVICCALAQVARKLLDRFTSIHGLVKELILEAIAAAELCSTCFELIIGKVVEKALWLLILILDCVFSCWQLRHCHLCSFLVHVDNLVVASVGRLDCMSIHAHGGHDRGTNDATRCRSENMGTTHGRLLRVATRAVLLVDGTGTNTQRQSFWRLFSWLASKSMQLMICFCLFKLSILAGFSLGWCCDWRHCNASLSLGIKDFGWKKTQICDNSWQLCWNLTCCCW